MTSSKIESTMTSRPQEVAKLLKTYITKLLLPMIWWDALGMAICTQASGEKYPDFPD